MLNSTTDQDNSNGLNPDIATDQSGSVTVTSSVITRVPQSPKVQQLLKDWQEKDPFNVRFNAEFPNYDWAKKGRAWEAFFQRKEVQKKLGFVDGKPENNAVNLAGKVELFVQAVELTSLGIPVMAFTADKSPFPKKIGLRQKLYDAPLSASDLLKSYKNLEAVGLVLLTGPVSPKHDMVAFDFEFPELKEKFISAVEAALPNLVDAIKETYWETTAGGGHHFLAFIPPGQGKDTKLARKKTGELDEKGNEKIKDLIEIKGKRNSCIIIAPSKAESGKSGVKAIGQYKSTNGPLINNDGLRAVTLDSSAFESLKAICRSFDEMPRKPEAKPQSIQKTINQSPFNLSGKPEGDWVVLNQFLRDCWGWLKVAEKFGFKIHSNKGPGYWYAFHPDTTDFTKHNVELGPKNSNIEDVCFIHSANETLSYYQVWKKYGGGMAELYKLARDAGYKMPGDDACDESRWDAICNPGDTEEESEESMAPDPKNKNDYKVQEAIRAESILKSPVENSLINIFGYTIKHTMNSLHAQSVIPYSSAIGLLGHYAAELFDYSGCPTVIHLINIALTGRGKDHPRAIMDLINTRLDVLQRRLNRKNKKKKSSDINEPIDSPEEEESLYDEKPKRKRRKKHKKTYVSKVVNPNGSWQGIQDRLKDSPHLLIILNELGLLFKGASTKGSEGDRSSSIIDSFRELWDCPKTYYLRAKANALDTKRKYIKNVLPSLIGFTQPGVFEKHFELDSLAGGTLNRLLIFEAGPRWIKDSDGNWIRPEWRNESKNQKEKRVNEIADKIHELIIYYTEKRKGGWEVLASEDFINTVNGYESKVISEQTRDQENDEEEEGIKERERQYAFRLAQIHLFSRMGDILEPVDFNWALGVIRLSQETQHRLAHKALTSNDNPSINAKIHAVMKKLNDKGKSLTPSTIGNRLYADKLKRKGGYFFAHHQPALIQLGWIKILGDGSYELTPKFWKVGKKQ